MPNTLSDELDKIMNEYPTSLRIFKNNSPTAYKMFKTSLQALILRERLEEAARVHIYRTDDGSNERQKAERITELTQQIESGNT